MRKAKQSVILATTLLLMTLGVAVWADKEQLMVSANPMVCCDYGKAIPMMFKKDLKECSVSINATLDASKTKDADGEVDFECVTECVLGVHGLLNEDKSIKEKELKSFLITRAPPGVKASLKTSLDECFEEHNSDTDRDDGRCKSGVEELLSCVVVDFSMNCPDDLWDSTKPQCRGA